MKYKKQASKNILKNLMTVVVATLHIICIILTTIVLVTLTVMIQYQEDLREAERQKLRDKYKIAAPGVVPVEKI